MEIFPIPLENPECFHISVLTKKCKDKFLNDTANYSGKNTKYINFVRNICKENIEQDKKLAIDCMNLLDKSAAISINRIAGPRKNNCL